MKLPDFKIERFFSRLEFAAPFMMCASDCESMSIGELLGLEDGAAGRFHEQRLGYTETAGAPSLRAEIAKQYSTVDDEGVLVHAGGEEVIFIFMNAVLTAGDHVIAHSPCYQSLQEIARGIGCEVTRWQARPESDWNLDLDFLKDAIGPKTRLIVINAPHNPTGHLPTKTVWREFFDIAREHDLLVFADEAYRGLEYDENDRLAAGCDMYERAGSLGLVSKGLGLPGLRIGWFATRNTEVLAKMASLKDYTTICSSAPSEFLAELGLRHNDELLQRARDIVLANLALLRTFFAKHQDRFGWVPPLAGSVTYPSLVGDGEVDAFCAEVLEAKGVLLLPGTAFSTPSREFRIGMGRKNMAEALSRFDEFLSS